MTELSVSAANQRLTDLYLAQLESMAPLSEQIEVDQRRVTLQNVTLGPLQLNQDTNLQPGQTVQGKIALLAGEMSTHYLPDGQPSRIVSHTQVTEELGYALTGSFPVTLKDDNLHLDLAQGTAWNANLANTGLANEQIASLLTKHLLELPYANAPLDLGNAK
ncbi:hypothetical protein EF910_02195 [Streptomyces sp. WAC07149]|uniref:hypothetical protein n=1 Tax=Streptomyces sp. WAC07149 TaxID=2487425 RepID=UPI000F7B1AF9|nr:hypothetical protein [Streptomyces sp. WAC07149]RST09036.1 hypothetical protein EF910_02195 [Streptomyces sp. WAC07149]